jgi:hypothetical protein
MKIGIVTLPFNWNYGGILQTYALQLALKDLGHEPFTINRDTVLTSFKLKVLLIIRRSILRIIGKKVIVRPWPTKTEEKIIRQHTDKFISEYIATTHLLKSETDFANLEKYKFEAFICGSDQVWRPKYSPVLENHFLGFLDKKSTVKRIAYAASFGVDNWEFSEKQTVSCSELAGLFNAISVREDSGINLCEKYLKVKAEQVLDPTMLITKEKYVGLVEKEKLVPFSGKLFNYVLDITPEKSKFIENVAERLGLVAFSSTAKSFRDLGKKRLKECIFPPVTQWIRGFMDAEFVITDSFHGTVFSIIFNKNFISIGNATRGMTRFTSLLKTFGLEERLILEINEHALQIADSPIDFKKVNEILETEREKSITFLKNALTV